MDENRIENYLNLIQELLNCPSGEEPEILQANSDLLDLGFLQVCAGVAGQLAEAGNENGAEFLRNLASQLGELLGMQSAGNGEISEDENIENYQNFILDLLQAEESDSDIATVIYPMLEERQHLLNGRFAEILQQVAENLIAEYPEAIESILGVIENLSIDINQFPLGSRRNNIEIAITGYQIVLSHQQTGSEKWAQTQNNLGNAYSDRIKGEKADNLELAIASYTAALEVYTRQAFPQDWAMTQNNLGTAYWDRIKGEKADNIKQAIKCYREALEICTPTAFPLDCLQTGRNLGNLAFELQDWENAIHGYGNAISAVEQSREWATSQRSKREILENALNIYEKMVQSCINAQRYDTALLTIERSKSRTLTELLDSANLEPRNATEDQKQRFRQLRRQINQLQQEFDHNETPAETKTDTDSKTQQRSISVAATSPSPTSPQQTQLKTLQQQLNQLLIEINDPTFTDTQKVTPQLPDFTQLLDDKTALIEWYLPPYAESGFYTFIVTISPGDPPKSPFTRGTLKDDDLSPFTRGTLKNPVPPLLRGVRGDQTDGDPPKSPFTRGTLNDDNPVPPLLRGVRGDQTDGDPPKSPFTRGTLKDPDPPKSPFTRGTLKDDNPVPPLLRGVRGDQPEIQYLDFSPQQRQQLDSDIATYLSDYRQTTWGDTLSSRLTSLAASLHLNEVLAKIPDSIEKLILIPHCDLHLLPLHALKGKRKQETEYLIDLFPQGIQYAPSCRVLEQLHQRQRHSPPKTSLFAIQNPTEDLDYTEIEVETISRQFNPDIHILKRSEATKKAFNLPENLAQLSAAYYAHFSCHGSFDAQNPLESALFFASEIAIPNISEIPATPENKHRYITLRNGRRLDKLTQGLTLKEIFANLRLPVCRLVTLSACETGLVERVSTDEYIGLPSGFFYAGARNVVSSLWCVSDFATAFLMIRFYQELDQISHIAIALQTAQKWFKSVNRANFLTWSQNEVKMDENQLMKLEMILLTEFPNAQPFAQPKYWAAFCPIGL